MAKNQHVLPHNGKWAVKGPLMDQQTAIRLRKRMAEEFREQLVVGAPTNEDEAGLRRLSDQLKPDS